MEYFWGDPRFVELLNEFIAHKDFDKFRELTYSRYTSYEFFSKSHKSFLLSQLLYSMIGDIMEKWYMNYNDEIAALPLETKERLYEEIQEFLSREKPENIDDFFDMDKNMSEIYRKLKYLLKK